MQAIEGFGLAVGGSVSVLIFAGYAICAAWGLKLLIHAVRLKHKKKG